MIGLVSFVTLLPAVVTAVASTVEVSFLKVSLMEVTKVVMFSVQNFDLRFVY